MKNKKQVKNLINSTRGSTIKEYKTPDSTMIVQNLIHKSKSRLLNYDSTLSQFNAITSNSIVFDKKSRLVSIFKDYLLLDEINDFFTMFYEKNEIFLYLTEILTAQKNYCYSPNYSSLGTNGIVLYKNKKKKLKYSEEPNNKKTQNKKKFSMWFDSILMNDKLKFPGNSFFKQLNSSLNFNSENLENLKIKSFFNDSMRILTNSIFSITDKNLVNKIKEIASDNPLNKGTYTRVKNIQSKKFYEVSNTPIFHQSLTPFPALGTLRIESDKNPSFNPNINNLNLKEMLTPKSNTPQNIFRSSNKIDFKKNELLLRDSTRKKSQMIRKIIGNKNNENEFQSNIHDLKPKVKGYFYSNTHKNLNIIIDSGSIDNNKSFQKNNRNGLIESSPNNNTNINFYLKNGFSRNFLRNDEHPLTSRDDKKNYFFNSNQKVLRLSQKELTGENDKKSKNIVFRCFKTSHNESICKELTSKNTLNNDKILINENLKEKLKGLRIEKFQNIIKLKKN